MRCPRHFADEIIDDLRWLGFESDGEILYQSERADIYLEAFNKLKAEGLVYDCFCSRADLRASSAHLQIFLYKKLGYNVPAFRHLPLLTAPDGRRLSKRDDDANERCRQMSKRRGIEFRRLFKNGYC